LVGDAQVIAMGKELLLSIHLYDSACFDSHGIITVHLLTAFTITRHLCLERHYFLYFVIPAIYPSVLTLDESGNGLKNWTNRFGIGWKTKIYLEFRLIPIYFFSIYQTTVREIEETLSECIGGLVIVKKGQEAISCCYIWWIDEEQRALKEIIKNIVKGCGLHFPGPIRE
jgi:hypothetical protein